MSFALWLSRCIGKGYGNVHSPYVGRFVADLAAWLVVPGIDTTPSLTDGNPMNGELFQQLAATLKEGGAILRGKKKASRTTTLQ